MISYPDIVFLITEETECWLRSNDGSLHLWKKIVALRCGKFNKDVWGLELDINAL